MGERSVTIALTTATLFAVASATAEDLKFSRDILPVLSDNCFHCHGPAEKGRKADLRLDTQDGATAANKKGRRAIVPGQSSSSEMMRRILSRDPDEVMPPPDSHKTLSPQQAEALKKWIDAGAPWGRHWAFEKPVRPPVSAADGLAEIDAIVREKLCREKLEFSPEADKETLLRRVTLDLTGLPPTREETRAFLADAAPGAYERVVDRLLASPHFGERMAWDWLDAARYADSNGYQGDGERTMWPWRDWVVQAFNRNLPYDQFTIWQLAGDLLPNATDEQKLATAFCRNHMINGEGGRIPEENRIDYGFDMTETYGTAWLGLTFYCARCHDHKFDPVSRREYYQIFAFFNQTPVDGSGGDPQAAPNLEIPPAGQREKILALQDYIRSFDKRIADRRNELAKQQDDWEAGMRQRGLAGNVWISLEPKEFSAKHQSLTKLDDGSILAGGENPDKDTYVVTCSPSAPLAAAALRLEALRHPSMTFGGLGRSDSGNFVLTEIEIEVRRTPEAAPERLQPAAAVATFEQDILKASKTYDGDPNTGWAVWNGKPIDRDHEAVFRFDRSVEVTPQSVFKITLRHDSGHKHHNLGRFRLSVSAEKNAPLPDTAQKLAAVLKIPREKRSDAERKLVAEAFAANDSALKSLLADKAGKEKEIADLKKGLPRVMIMQDRAERRDTFMLDKGLYDKPGEKVDMAVPVSLHTYPATAPKNRLGLAQWTVSPENPLTSRVVVNRFWQQFFGLGLVKTVEDFGVQGERPPQQDLLDWLAVEFVESGWDVKKLVRRIVTSRTYRQSSRIPAGMAERDPDNRLLARGPRFRMPSWMLRDQTLAASGLLVKKLGGPGVNTYQPPGIWEETTFGNKKFQQDHGESLYRRSLYTFWRRIIAPTMFFDNASRQTCTVKALRTNTPLQALLTLNDVPFVEAARVLAERTLIAPGSPAERLAAAFQDILTRKPTAEEIALLLAALDRSRQEFRAAPEAALRILAVGEAKRNEALDAVEHAAWTQVCLTMFNLDEAVTKE